MYEIRKGAIVVSSVFNIHLLTVKTRLLMGRLRGLKTLTSVRPLVKQESESQHKSHETDSSFFFPQKVSDSIKMLLRMCTFARSMEGEQHMGG